MMEQKPHNVGVSFELLGHLNPLRDEKFYPLPVYTIGTFNGRLLYIFKNGDGKLECGDFLGEFTRYNDETKKGLYGFDPERHLLFAFSDTDVIAYDMVEEQAFFKSLLQDPEFCADKPFHRWEFAQMSEDPYLISVTRKAVEDYMRNYNYKMEEDDSFTPISS